jgi:hypothetical protein
MVGSEVLNFWFEKSGQTAERRSSGPRAPHAVSPKRSPMSAPRISRRASLRSRFRSSVSSDDQIIPIAAHEDDRSVKRGVAVMFCGCNRRTCPLAECQLAFQITLSVPMLPTEMILSWTESQINTKRSLMGTVEFASWTPFSFPLALASLREVVVPGSG